MSVQYPITKIDTEGRSNTATRDDSTPNFALACYNNFLAYGSKIYRMGYEIHIKNMEEGTQDYGKLYTTIDSHETMTDQTDGYAPEYVCFNPLRQNATNVAFQANGTVAITGGTSTDPKILSVFYDIPGLTENVYGVYDVPNSINPISSSDVEAYGGTTYKVQLAITSVSGDPYGITPFSRTNVIGLCGLDEDAAPVVGTSLVLVGDSNFRNAYSNVLGMVKDPSRPIIRYYEKNATTGVKTYTSTTGILIPITDTVYAALKTTWGISELYKIKHTYGNAGNWYIEGFNFFSNIASGNLFGKFTSEGVSEDPDTYEYGAKNYSVAVQKTGDGTDRKFSLPVSAVLVAQTVNEEVKFFSVDNVSDTDLNYVANNNRVTYYRDKKLGTTAVGIVCKLTNKVNSSEFYRVPESAITYSGYSDSRGNRFYIDISGVYLSTVSAGNYGISVYEDDQEITNNLPYVKNDEWACEVKTDYSGKYLTNSSNETLANWTHVATYSFEKNSSTIAATLDDVVQVIPEPANIEKELTNYDTLEFSWDYNDDPDLTGYTYKFGINGTEIVVPLSSCTINTTTNRVSYNITFTTRQTTTLYLRANYTVNSINYYSNYSSFYTVFSGIETPTVYDEVRIESNVIRISWSAVEFATSYTIVTYDDAASEDVYEIHDQITNTYYDYTFSSINNMKYYIFAVPSNLNFYSDRTDDHYYLLTKIDTPVITVDSTTGLDQIKFAWDPVDFARGYFIQIYDYNTENTTFLVAGSTTEEITYTADAPGKKDFRIQALAENLASLVSEYGSILTHTFYSLNTPTLTKTETISPVEDSTGVTAVTLSWTPIANAGGYILKDTYVTTTESGTTTTYIYNTGYDGTVSSTSKYFDTANLNYGQHTFNVRAVDAVYSTLSDTVKNSLQNDIKLSNFDSDISNEFMIERSLLPAPTINWLSTTSGLMVDQSTVVHDSIENADYYKLEIYDQNNLTTYFKTITLSKDNTSINIASAFDTFLLSANYNIAVRAHSYDTLYYTYSTASNILTYETIQLDAPTDLIWESTTDTLSWTYPTFDASVYGLSGTLYFEVYTLEDDSTLTLVETTTAKQITISLAAGLYKFVVKAYFTASGIV